MVGAFVEFSLDMLLLQVSTSFAGEMGRAFLSPNGSLYALLLPKRPDSFVVVFAVVVVDDAFFVTRPVLLNKPLSISSISPNLERTAPISFSVTFSLLGFESVRIGSGLNLDEPEENLGPSLVV
ncbi:hypothetical protein BDR26DRAFT_871146 [Obelidium mucronatum]|nr:hypothetical protein BDR26DRAFT_871146 [Obelidium mucronatum]